MYRVRIITLLLLPLSSISQGKISIKGNISLITPSTTVYISGNGGNFSSKIEKDGSFKLEGELTENGLAIVRTDSSASDGIWLEPGNYEVVCREIRKEGIQKALFRIPVLNGPRDAQIVNGYTQKLYDISPASYRQFSMYYLDSIFKNHPRSKALPHLISRAQNFIGEEVAKFYSGLLDPEQKTDQYAHSLDNYLKQQEKIRREMLFQDFTMPDLKGKIFSLSQLLNKKLILVDFWSSDCYPCRKKHERLKDLHEKYGKKGLEIISISLDTERKEWEKASIVDGISWINLSELKGWQTPIAEDYYIKSLPSQFWLDGSKTILGTELSIAEIEKRLE